MISITDELIEKLEKLAMIKLSSDEKDTIKKDLSDILKYMQMIDEIDTTNVEPLFSPVEKMLKNIFHGDKEKVDDAIKSILDEFPEKKNNLLKVPGIHS